MRRPGLLLLAVLVSAFPAIVGAAATAVPPAKSAAKAKASAPGATPVVVSLAPALASSTAAVPLAGPVGGTAPADSEPLVAAILIEGAVNVPPADISAHLKTRIGALMTSDGLRDDLKAVWAMDRFDDVSVDATPVAGGYRITFLVKERPVLREVRYVKIKELDDKELKEKVPLQAGDFYDAVKEREAEQNILQVYHDKGFPDAVVKGELVPAEKEPGKMDLVLSVDAGTKMHVSKILFAGNRALPDSALKKILKNKEKAFFFQSGLYLKDELDRDRERIAEFYKNEGYQKAKVLSAEVLPSPKGDKDLVDLKFTVTEGGLYYVHAVVFSGASMFPEKELRERLALNAGAKLSQRQLDEGLGKIRDLYTKRGYIYASVTPDLVFDDAAGQADVSVRIHEGTIAYVDRILIRGNEETKDKVIFREIRNVKLEEGQEFDTDKIRKAQEKIYNLGFFDDVKVYTEPSLKSGKENLIFDVKERQTGSISLGGGYSSQFGLVGFLQLTKANLFGLGIRVSAEWEIGQKRRNVSLDYFDPYFLDSPVSLSLSFWDTDRDLPNTFEQISTGGSVSFGERFWTDWRAEVGYKYEVDTVRQLPGIALPAGVTTEPTATSSPNVRISLDERDNVFDPFRGVQTSLFAQVAGGPLPNLNFLGGDTRFYKVIWDGSVFVPAPTKVLPYVPPPSLGLHTRIGRGWGFQGQDVPIYERFFLGGTDSVRGYNERVLGPIDSSTGEPSGGNAEWQFNAEVKWPLVPRIFTLVAPFYDIGNAWTSFPFNGPFISQEIHRLPQSAGIGFRLTIPNTILVIRIDYGWGLTKFANPSQSPPPTGKLAFNIGNIF